MGIPANGRSTVENPVNLDDLGVTPILGNHHFVSDLDPTIPHDCPGRNRMDSPAAMMKGCLFTSCGNLRMEIGNVSNMFRPCPDMF